MSPPDGILVLGASGFLGSTIVRRHPEVIPSTWRYESGGPSFLGGPPLDAMGVSTFGAVINCAALADVDRCQAEPALAETLNSALPGALAVACMLADIRLIHVSTDYVFGGAGQWAPFETGHNVHPVNVYGRTKADGEVAVRNHGGVVVRTAGLYSADQGFLPWLARRSARPTAPLTSPAERRFNVTRVEWLADGLVALARAGLGGGGDIFHYVGPEIRPYELAKDMGLEVFDADPARPAPRALDTRLVPTLSHGWGWRP